MLRHKISGVQLLFWSIFLVGLNSVSAQLWITTLPQDVQDSIYWCGDHEEGTTHDWTMDSWIYPGGGIFNTGGTDAEVELVNSIAHSGNYSLKSTIHNAFQGQNGNKAVRLMRWTDTAWDDGGAYFPTCSYYSAFYFFPNSYNPNKYPPWDPGDGGWWNIFQFKSDDANGQSQPVWTMNISHDDATNEMSAYLYTHENMPMSYEQSGSPIPIPVNEWVHFEFFYKASNPNTNNGALKVWQNGALLFDINNIVTTLAEGQVVWGIGNYTDHIDGGLVPGEASIYFDDAIVSTLPVHPHLDVILSTSDLAFQASLEQEGVVLEWNNLGNPDLQAYKIQRSFNGIDFETVQLINQELDQDKFRFIDACLDCKNKIYYQLFAMNADGQESISEVVLVDVGLPLYEISPNPFQNKIQIISKRIPFSLKVLDLFGNEVLQKRLYNHTESIDLMDLPKGIYFISLKDKSGMLLSFKKMMKS